MYGGTALNQWKYCCKETIKIINRFGGSTGGTLIALVLSSDRAGLVIPEAQWSGIDKATMTDRRSPKFLLIVVGMSS